MIPTLTQPPAGPPLALARLAAHPDDPQALHLLRATFAIASAPPLVELAGAAVHLIDRIREGSVGAGGDTVALLGEAYARLGGTEQGGRLALVERLDACASGLGGIAPAADGTAVGGVPAPPLLTVRQDGATVLPGTFEPTDASSHVPLAQAASGEPASGKLGGLGDVAAALETACLRLAAQVGTLELLAGKDLQRLVNELAATSVAIDGQRRALAAWLAADGGGAGSA